MSKIAIVTGAYQGIGKGIADGLKGAGYTVIYSDVHGKAIVFIGNYYP